VYRRYGRYLCSKHARYCRDLREARKILKIVLTSDIAGKTELREKAEK
jgi:hypothetical protein